MYRILIVEDNEANWDMLSRRLQRRGFSTSVAEDGRQGVQKAQADMPDLILMDLSLPEMDGCAATTALKRDPVTANIPVIVLTAHALVRDHERAFAAGCDDFATKPLEFEKLLGKMATLLHARQTATVM